MSDRICPPGRHLSGYMKPTSPRRWRDRHPDEWPGVPLGFHAIGEILSLLTIIWCMSEPNPPMVVQTIAILLAAAVIPISACHLLEGD